MHEVFNIHLWLYDTKTNQSRQLTAGENSRNGVWGLDFAPDGKILYETQPKKGSDIFELDAETGETRRLTNLTDTNMKPAVSPDETFVAFASDRSGARRIWLCLKCA